MQKLPVVGILQWSLVMSQNHCMWLNSLVQAFKNLREVLNRMGTDAIEKSCFS